MLGVVFAPSDLIHPQGMFLRFGPSEKKGRNIPLREKELDVG